MSLYKVINFRSGINNKIFMFYQNSLVKNFVIINYYDTFGKPIFGKPIC